MNTNLNMAVLIDGDNIPSAYVKEMMEEIAKYGNPTIKEFTEIGQDRIDQVEKCFARKCDKPNPTIRLYHWRECNRLGNDY